MAWWVGLIDRGQGQGVKYLNGSSVNSSMIPWNDTIVPTPASAQQCAYFVNGSMGLSNCTNWFGFVCEREKSKPFPCDAEEQWVFINGTCFKYFNLNQTWNEAGDTCQKNDGSLAKVVTSEEAAYIWDQSKVLLTSSWIGLQLNLTTQRYQWTDGSPLNISISWWAENQPVNQSQSKTSLCAFVNGNTRRLSSWSTQSCDVRNSFTCMKPQGVCSDGWISHLATCFKFFPRLKLSWVNARNYCLAMGADIIKIPTQSYQNEINEYLQELKASSIDSFWIGISNVGGRFTWADGSNFGNFSNWVLPPANFPGSFGYIETDDSTGKWQLTNSSVLKSFGCSISGNKPVKEVLITTSNFSCDPGWIVAGDSCIFISDEDVSWYTAKMKCQSLQSQLVVINSDDIQSVLEGLITSDQYWIGLDDTGSEGNFTWINGTLLNTTHWAVGEPDNKDDENCVVLKPVGGQIKWFDMRCLDFNSFICQKAPSGISTVATFTTTQAPYSAKCGLMWEERPGTDLCYQFRVTKLSWSDAMALCAYYNGSLVSITSRDEQSYIEGRLRSQDDLVYWIGATDSMQEAGWRWEDGSPFSYLNWETGQPNQYGDEDCAGMKTSNMRWHDFSCSLRNSFICKKRVKSMTSTSTTTQVSLPAGKYYGCPPGWLPYNNNCYLIKRNPATWKQAQIACRQESSDLASIQSVQENEFIWTKLPEKTCRGNNLHSNNTQCDTWASTGECGKNPSWMLVNCQASCYCNQTCADKYNQWQCKYWAGIGECLSNLKWMWDNCPQSCGCDPTVNEGYWTGLNDLQVQMNFVWSDLSEVRYTNWLPNEPNNFNGKNEDCVKLHKLTGQWSDEVCDVQTAGYVCKRAMEISDHPTVPPHVVGCPANGFGYRATCFVMVDEPKTWADARSYCARINATLASIPDSITGAFVSTELMGKTSSYWIGLSNMNGKYTWADGASVQYTAWVPSHTGNENNSCVAVRTQRPFGLWEDLSCQLKQPSLCQTSRRGFTTPPPTTTPQPTTLAPCPSPWKGRGDHCYEMFTATKTWSDAQRHCQVFGGSLMSVHSNDTLQFVVNSIMNRYGVRIEFWIGLSDVDKETSYVWSDGSPFDYSFWGQGEPNSATPLEDCVEVDAFSLLWNDNNCNLLRPYVCSIVRGVPLPTLTTTPATTQAPKCADQAWTLYKGNCYYVSPNWGLESRLSWFAARRKCLSVGADLVSISSEGENNFLTTLLSSFYTRQYWIGLNQLDQEAYVWSDNKPTVYVSWANNEPNDGYGAERCVDIGASHGHWIDDNCMATFGYICKRPGNSSGSTLPPPTPTPVIDGVCPPGFVSEVSSSKCYYIGGLGNDSLKDPKLGWEAARNACRTLTSPKRVDIGSINSQLDQDIVTLLMSKLTSDLWIGLSDRAQVNTFSWGDNSEVTFTNWAGGEPQFHYGTWQVDNCVEMLIKPGRIEDTAKWNDAQCIKKNAYLCQTMKVPSQSTTVVPTPTSMCPKDFVQHKTICYSFINRPQTWEEARTSCRNLGGDLAATLDVFEVARLDLGLYNKNIMGQAWIGMKFDEMTSEYTWTNGWPVLNTFWSAGNPNLQTNDSCVAFSNTKWNDTQCGDSLPFICEIRRELPPTPTPTPRGHCVDPKHLRFGDHCYLIKLDDLVSWPEAAFSCNQLGMQLASVHSASESSFLFVQLQNPVTTTRNPRVYTNYNYGVKTNIWLGLRRDLKGGYTWSDKSEATYFNWATGEPSMRFTSGVTVTEEECVEMYRDSGRWNDISCLGNNRGYVCKVSQVFPTTLPTTTPSTPEPLVTVIGPDTPVTDILESTTNVIVTLGHLPAVLNPENDENRLTGGQIAGIVIGLIIAAVIVAVVIVVIRKTPLPPWRRVNLFQQDLGYENALYMKGDEDPATESKGINQDTAEGDNASEESVVKLGFSDA